MAYVKFNNLMILFYSILVGIFVVFTITFITAYLNPQKKVIVDINSIGEAKLELLLIIVTWVLMVYSLYYIYSNVNRNRSLEEIIKKT